LGYLPEQAEPQNRANGFVLFILSGLKILAGVGSKVFFVLFFLIGSKKKKKKKLRQMFGILKGSRVPMPCCLPFIPLQSGMQTNRR